MIGNACRLFPDGNIYIYHAPRMYRPNRISPPYGGVPDGFQIRGSCRKVANSAHSGGSAFPSRLNLFIRAEQLRHSRGVIMSGRISDFVRRAHIFAQSGCPRRELRIRRRKYRFHHPDGQKRPRCPVNCAKWAHCE